MARENVIRSWMIVIWCEPRFYACPRESDASQLLLASDQLVGWDRQSYRCVELTMNTPLSETR